MNFYSHASIPCLTSPLSHCSPRNHLPNKQLAPKLLSKRSVWGKTKIMSQKHACFLQITTTNHACVLEPVCAHCPSPIFRPLPPAWSLPVFQPHSASSPWNISACTFIPLALNSPNLDTLSAPAPPDVPKHQPPRFSVTHPTSFLPPSSQRILNNHPFLCLPQTPAPASMS